MSRLRRPAVTIAAALTALGAVAVPAAGASTEPPGQDDAIVIDEALVESARAGLAGWLDVNRPPTPLTSTDLAGCPAIDVAAFADVLGEHGVGIDPAPASTGWGTEIEWNEYGDLSPDMIGIFCGGDTDGDPHDTPIGGGFGVFAVELVDPATLADLAAWTTLGIEFAPGADGDEAVSCGEIGDSYCLALWHHDGLVLGVVLFNDVVPADEAAMPTIAASLVPQILTTLGAAEPVVATPR